MVQVFMVLRCCTCDTFQVHQVKKTNKWVCKVCGQKQSINKVYGKGKATECRTHVQKLNMMRGEREKEELSVAMAKQENHPPEDYASTFEACERVQEEPSSHPVLVSGRASKWTTFIEPQDSEEESGSDTCTDGMYMYTIDRDEYNHTHKKSRKVVKRRSSDIYPLSKSARTSLPQSSGSKPGMAGMGGAISPYSSVNQDMKVILHEPAHTLPKPGRVKSAQSCYILAPTTETYRKLQDESYPFEDEAVSQSMQDLTSPSRSNHKESMLRIREDIKYSELSIPNKTTGSPKMSKWSKFVCKSEDGEDSGTYVT